MTFWAEFDILYNMKGFRCAVEAALTDYVVRMLGVQPDWKPSKLAHLASSSFLRTDAQAAAAVLHARRDACTLFGAPLISSVSERSGWLLVSLTADAIDAFAVTLPPAEEPDDAYLSRRLWAMARRPDAKTPDDPALLLGFYALLFGAPNGAERFLSAPRAHDGAERVAIERRLSRMATILLWERRNCV